MVVLDLTLANAEAQFGRHDYTIGRYDEKRGIYKQFSALFAEERNVHLGIDLGAPVHTAIYAPCKGTVAFVGYNELKGDYGWCLITRHVLQGVEIYFLFGHLSAETAQINKVGAAFEKGAVLGYLGDESENGGWPPHVHFQLSFRKPVTHDLPGVCTESQREQCLKEFPDPRLVLGKIY